MGSAKTSTPAAPGRCRSFPRAAGARGVVWGFGYPRLSKTADQFDRVFRAFFDAVGFLGPVEVRDQPVAGRVRAHDYGVAVAAGCLRFDPLGGVAGGGAHAADIVAQR